MSKATSVSTGLSLARLDGRVRFALEVALVVAVNLALVAVVAGGIDERTSSAARRSEEARRAARIAQQDWWIEDDRKLQDVRRQAETRFWRGDTLGLVRAEVEGFVQGLIGKHQLKGANVLVETNAVATDGIDQLKAQVRVTGPTAAIIDLASDLAASPKDVQVTRVSLRFFKNQIGADIGLTVPIGVARAALPEPPRK